MSELEKHGRCWEDETRLALEALRAAIAEAEGADGSA